MDPKLLKLMGSQDDVLDEVYGPAQAKAKVLGKISQYASDGMANGLRSKFGKGPAAGGSGAAGGGNADGTKALEFMHAQIAPVKDLAKQTTDENLDVLADLDEESLKKLLAGG